MRGAKSSAIVLSFALTVLCLGSVAARTRIPLINNHLDRHLASPDAACALFLVGSCCKSPMTAFPVNRKRWWNT